MAKVKIIEEYKVAPPSANTTTSSELHNSSSPNSLPLTFLDLIWLRFPPLQAGNLIWPESSYKPLILYNEGDEDDAVSFSVAEIDADFRRLSSTNELLEATEYNPLIPSLAASRERAAILAFQVTLFLPNYGFSIGMANHHAALDGKSVHMFLKTWTHICRLQREEDFELKPFF
uniref:Uncharacterized protein n=1 Tax=Cannabis sativa TaxID=3483 RepID=A0A803PG65_CANSA